MNWQGSTHQKSMSKNLLGLRFSITNANSLTQYGFLFASLLIAAALKLALLWTESVPFNSDEAIIGLMARHILQGERPIFFYGQAYMGSLDAWLVSSAFAVFGESILAIRLVQLVLYLAFILTAWMIAKRVFPDPRIANLVAILAAIPPLLITTYTTATLGGYGETLVLGNIILLFGYEVAKGRWCDSFVAWFFLGIVGGLAFWTLGLAVIYLAAVFLFILWAGIKRERVSFYLVALLGFALGSAPWWISNITNQGSALAVLTQGSPAVSTPLNRFLGMLLLGFPALLGLRAPWEPGFASLIVITPLILLYIGLGIFLLKNKEGRWPAAAEDSGKLYLLLVIIFIVFFVGTQFGLDATGRYFLPLFIPLLFIQAVLILALWKWNRLVGAGILGFILLSHFWLTFQAAASEAKITTQFDPITRFDNEADGRLIDFLQGQGETHGYSNYWVSFRLAFLSDENLIYSAELPYKLDFRYTPKDQRYPAYREMVNESSRVAYITTHHDPLDQRLREEFQEHGIQFEEIKIGPYQVFYKLSERIQPEELNLTTTEIVP